MILISNSKHWLIDQAEMSGEQDFLLTDQTVYSYSKILEKSIKAASFLRRVGISENERIPILTDNSIEFVILLNALWMLNATPVPVNPKMPLKEYQKICTHLNVIHFIKINNSTDLELDGVEQINFNKTSFSTDSQLKNISNFDPENICLMMYTSGSTSTPKCVQLTYNNLFSSIKAMDVHISHCDTDIWFASLPFYHIGGLSILLRSIAAGCSTVIPNSLTHNEILSGITKFQPTLISVVPTMLHRLLDDFVYPWGNLKNILVGGGPISDEIIRISLDKRWPISVVYGSTETASMVTISNSDNLSKFGLSAGKPLPGVKVFIDDNNEYTNLRGEGRIIVKSKSISKSYFKPNKSEGVQLSNGKYYSNDLGKIDKNGNLHIIGRIDDIIISGGENISLIEIENLLNSNTEFSNCVCLAVKDEKWGQSYIIVTDSKVDKVEGEILKYLSENLIKYKLPKNIFSIRKIPFSQLGKPLKSEIKKNISADFL